MILQGIIADLTYKQAVKNYIKAAIKGVVKTISKMGISTIQSYCGAQIFEALGIHQSVIDKYFTRTPSRIGGIGIDVIAEEAELRHAEGYPDASRTAATWKPAANTSGGSDGEYHLFNPGTIHGLQQACQTGNYELFKRVSQSVNEQTTQLGTLRGLLEFKFAANRSRSRKSSRSNRSAVASRPAP